MHRGAPLPAPRSGMRGAYTPRPPHSRTLAASAPRRLASQYSSFGASPRRLRYELTHLTIVWFLGSVT